MTTKPLSKKELTTVSTRGSSGRRDLTLQNKKQANQWSLFIGAMILVLLPVPSGLGQISGETKEPHWIGPPSNTPDGVAVTFEKTFSLQKPMRSARVRFATSYAHLVISVDGSPIVEAEAFDSIRELSIPRSLAVGRHVLRVDATPLPGPSAFFLELQESLGKSPSIVTDSTWTVTSHANQTQSPATTAVHNRGPVHAELLIPDSLRVGIDMTDNYEQWKQAIDAVPGNEASFFVTPGFEFRQVATAGPDEGSWVSMVFDARGRVIVAREDAGLIRMTLSRDGSRVLNRESIEESLKECRGLTFLGDDLYANANNSKGLYVLRSQSNGFSKPELVLASSGGVGHGRNDLTVGPDDKLYSIHGDAVDLPKNVRDYTSPFREAKRGQKTSEGYLLRVDPESKSSEVLSAGLRNPFGIDFHRHGEAFTYDADAEYDMGAPWYRPTRVNHLVIGADYGWRGVTKQWPPYYPDHPDNAPANLDVGKGSPTAVKFGYRSNFPERFRSSLFVLDWAYGRVLSVHPVARGASYMMTMETFLKGRPLNVTDLDFGADGNMYLITGGRKTQSALYQVRYTGASSKSDSATRFSQELETVSGTARQRRRQLEEMLMSPELPTDFDTAWESLSEHDPWIQHAAMRVLERCPVQRWEDRAYAESDPRASSAALLCLVRSGEANPVRTIHRLLKMLPGMTYESDRLRAYHSIWQVLKGGIDPKLASEVVTTLSSDYPSKSRRNPTEENRLLSQILIGLQSPEATRTTFNLINQSTSPAQRLHFLFVLRDAQTGWDESLQEQYLTSLRQAEQALGGAGLPEFIRRIRQDFLKNTDPARREALASIINPSAETSTPSPQNRPLVKKWTLKNLHVSSNGSVKNGAEVFRDSGCIQCHRFGSRGTLLGPDLTSVGRRFGTTDLLRSIIHPSEVIAEKYRSVQILMQDGRSFVGQPRQGGDYRSPMLELATDPQRPSMTTRIAKNEIATQKDSEISWMPEGLLDTFTEEEIADLLAYLQSPPQ